MTHSLYKVSGIFDVMVRWYRQQERSGLIRHDLPCGQCQCWRRIASARLKQDACARGTQFRELIADQKTVCFIHHHYWNRRVRQFSQPQNSFLEQRVL